MASAFVKQSSKPRQQASDQLWEGTAWVSGEDLAQLMNKRPRKRGVGVGADAGVDVDVDVQKQMQKQKQKPKPQQQRQKSARPRRRAGTVRQRAAVSSAAADTEMEEPDAASVPPTPGGKTKPKTKPRTNIKAAKKRKRDGAAESCSDTDAANADADTDADTDADADADESGHVSAEEPLRKRDKDRIPSATVTVVSGGVLRVVPRPRTMQCGMFFAYVPIPPKQKALLQCILDSPSSAPDEAFLRAELVPRLNRTHPVSLRLLDWFVVDYAQECNVAYTRFIPELGRSTIVYVHKVYITWRDQWRRRHFDPFRRRHRIYFVLDGETYSTTVAQLHFFSVARTFGFLEYAAQHLEEIDAHQRAAMCASADGDADADGNADADADVGGHGVDHDAETAAHAAACSASASAKAEALEARRRPLVCRPQPQAFMSECRHVVSFGSDAMCDDDEDDEDADAAKDDSCSTDSEWEGGSVTLGVEAVDETMFPVVA
jgi:hypothetical protein